MSTASRIPSHWMQRKTVASPKKAPLVALIDLTDDDLVLCEQSTPCPSPALEKSSSILPPLQKHQTVSLDSACIQIEDDAKSWLKHRPSIKYARREILQKSVKQLRESHRLQCELLQLAQQQEIEVKKRFNLAQKVLADIRFELDKCKQNICQVDAEKKEVEQWQSRLRQVVFEIDDVESSQQESVSTLEYSSLVAPVATPLPGEYFSMDSLPIEF